MKGGDEGGLSGGFAVFGEGVAGCGDGFGGVSRDGAMEADVRGDGDESMSDGGGKDGAGGGDAVAFLAGDGGR